jgi:hypothetical protein
VIFPAKFPNLTDLVNANRDPVQGLTNYECLRLQLGTSSSSTTVHLDRAYRNKSLAELFGVANGLQDLFKDQVNPKSCSVELDRA